jgi:hypothetical protein
MVKAVQANISTDQKWVLLYVKRWLAAPIQRNHSGQQARGGFQGLPVMASRSASRTLSPCFPTVEM